VKPFAKEISVSERLNDVLAQLAAGPADRALVDFEIEFERRLSRRRAEVRSVRDVGIASVAIALALGMVTGQTISQHSKAVARPGITLAADTRLAPSYLLDADR
jgi:hypothetical protein